LVPSANASVLLFGLTTALIQAPGGANAAAIQEIVPNRLRGRITALYYVAMGLSSMTLGPLVIGVMNDHVFTGAGSVGKSMSLTALVTLPVASMLLFIAARRRAKLV
jgi:MFS family permease